MVVKIGFGVLGAAAYSHGANLFDDLFFSTNTPAYLIISAFIFTSKFSVLNNYLAFSVLPHALRSSLLAKYFLFISGMCEEPFCIVLGIIVPWIAGAMINHLQIYSYLINWTALITIAWVQLVCPLFMWSKASKEAHIFESNFKASMQMILAPHNPSYTEDQKEAPTF